jgi:hypothetical protein
MNSSLKRKTIYSYGQYLITFYWATWSLNVVMVKEHKITGSVAWKEMRTLPIARKLWKTFKIDAERIGKKHTVTYDEGVWDTERIKYVRQMLAE